MSAAVFHNQPEWWKIDMSGLTAFVRSKEEDLLLLMKIDDLLLDARRLARDQKVENRIHVGLEADSRTRIETA